MIQCVWLQLLKEHLKWVNPVRLITAYFFLNVWILKVLNWDTVISLTLYFSVTTYMDTL